MHRFILSSVTAESGRVLLDSKESHHARNVLRVKLGEGVELLNGRGSKFRATVAGFEEGRVVLSVDRSLPAGWQGAGWAAQSLEITLAPAVIKPERMEWMLEKSCELGVTEWAPILTERSTVKLSRERWQAKTERWRKIAAESCKQCGQARVPSLRQPVLFKELLLAAATFEAAWIPSLCFPGEALQTAFSKAPKVTKVLVLVGPEGDFTEGEVRQAVSKGIKPVSLGPSVLRAETAALYVLSAAQFFYGSSDRTEDLDK